MIKETTSLLALLLLISVPALGQFYPTQHRPPGQDWQQLSTPHFNILFPAGADSSAWQTAHILEQEYPGVRRLTGGSLTGFPIILSRYNDRANGFVTSLHFRSEIDLPPLRGKAMNPRTGGWLQNVVPHEVVHALHFSNLGGFGVGQLVNLFSPDMARSMHGAVPAGIPEGLAVYYESTALAPGGGRGNYPYFTGQFDAVFDSGHRWSMGQMVHIATDTRPVNRHYIGGYTFTRWLQDTYGEETSRKAISFNIAWPFLGYGVALKHATGRWPSQLYREFEDSRSSSSPPAFSYETLPVHLDGAEVRRPMWLSDSTLLFHASFYNGLPGFYRYQLDTGRIERILTTRITPDYRYDLSADRNTIFYSYYDADTRYPDVFKGTLMSAPLTGGPRRLLSSDRLVAPAAESDSSLLAIQTKSAHPSLLSLKTDSTNHSVSILYRDPSAELVAVTGHPAGDSVAVVMNRNGRQGLWIAPRDSAGMHRRLTGAPDVAFAGGSVFDPVWHPAGDRLLFSSDLSGRMQIYEYALQSGRVRRLTHARYNAFEASYSPGGDRIAFIIQRQNEHLPVVLSRDDFDGQEVANETVRAYTPGLQVPRNENSTWQQQDYRTGFGWLKPRSLLPVADEVSGSDSDYQLGLGLHSSDLLQQQAYSLQLTTLEDRLWYDLSYQNKQFFPGFRARVFSRPAYRRYSFTTAQDQPVIQTFLRQERSLALSVPLQFTFSKNVDFTGLYLEPELRQSQMRFFSGSGTSVSDFSQASIGNLFGQFHYRLRQTMRDVQPRSGLVLYGELEHYLHSEGLTLQTTAGDRNLDRARPTALRAGLYGYLAPLKRWNQSLRIGLAGVTQSIPVFDNQSVVSQGFRKDIFPLAHNLMSFSTRYTVPLLYPDNGGLLLPLYLTNIYLAGFSNTVINPNQGELFRQSRTVIGGGIRFRFRISNLSVDIGAGVGWEPTRHNMHYFIGNF